MQIGQYQKIKISQAFFKKIRKNNKILGLTFLGKMLCFRGGSGAVFNIENNLNLGLTFF